VYCNFGTALSVQTLWVPSINILVISNIGHGDRDAVGSISLSAVENVQLMNCRGDEATVLMLSKLPKNLKSLKIELDFRNVDVDGSTETLSFDMCNLALALMPAGKSLEILVLAINADSTIPDGFWTTSWWRYDTLRHIKRLSATREYMVGPS
jgi:hypothetical protein